MIVIEKKFDTNGNKYQGEANSSRMPHGLGYASIKENDDQIESELISYPASSMKFCKVLKQF